MGKKGKAERKKKLKAFISQKKKEARKDRQKRLKRRKPLSQDLVNVQAGIEDFIRESGQEPSPIAYFGCIRTLLESKPDPRKIPYFLALLDIHIHDLSEGILKKNATGLLALLNKLISQHMADTLIAKKGLQIFKSLFILLPPSPAMLHQVRAFEPNKMHSELMPLYMRAVQTIFIEVHKKNPKLCYTSLAPLLVASMGNFFDTAEVVANTTAEALRKIFAEAITSTFARQHKADLTKILDALGTALVEIHYRTSWDLIAQLTSTVLGNLSRLRCQIAIHEEFPAVVGLLKTLDSIRSLNDFHYNNATEAAIGSAVQCLPVELVLQHLPINIEEKDPEAGRHYLLSVLRKHVSHDSAKLYIKVFAPMIARCKKLSEDALLHGKHIEKQTYRLMSTQVWELLPAFVTFASDIGEGNTFKLIAKELTGLLNNPELSKIACRAFSIMIEKNRYLAEYTKPEPKPVDEDSDSEDDEEGEGKKEGDADSESEHSGEESDAGEKIAKMEHDEESDDEVEQMEAGLDEMMGIGNIPVASAEEDPHVFHGITREQAQANVALMASFAKNVLPLLCNAIEKETSDRKTMLLQTLRVYAGIADSAIISGLFKQVTATLQQLDSEKSAKNQLMMDIGCVLAEYLDEGSLDTLLNIIAPLLKDPTNDYLLQKKAYKALARICKTRDEVSGRRTQIERIELMLAEAQNSCDPSAKRERLHCIGHVALMYSEIPSRQGQLKQFIAGTTPEVILAVKEVNTRARSAAFLTLGVFAELLELNPFTTVLLAGLAGTTPALISCTVISLSKIVSEYGDAVEAKLLETVVAASFALIQHRSNEIKNAAMHFAKVVLRSAREHEELRRVLLLHLQELVVGCLAWSSQRYVPGNTRRTIRTIFERALRRFGMDTLREHFPEEHKKYIDYIDKERQRETKRKLKEREKMKQEREQVRQLKEQGAVGVKGMKMKEGDDAMEFDLLDPSAVKQFVVPRERTLLDEEELKRAKEDGFHVTMKNGQMVVQTDAEFKQDVRNKLVAKKLEQMEGVKRHGFADVGKVTATKRGRFDDDDDEVMHVEEEITEELKDLQAALKKKPTKQDRLSDNPSKKRKRLDSDVKTGAHFRAPKGSYGDVKKGGLDPYAYVPLNAKFLNKRHRMKGMNRVEAVHEKVLKGGKAKGKRAGKDEGMRVPAKAGKLAGKKKRTK